MHRYLPDPAPALRLLIAAVSDDRLRDLGWSKARRLDFKKAKATNGAAAAAKPDHNTVRRERRAAERAAKAAQKAGNGHSNGNGERISAEAGDDLNLGCMSGR